MSGKHFRSAQRADLSQHFLRSGSLARSLVDQASISSDDVVVEVGPGRGILTVELARRCREVIAVEVDPVLGRDLGERFRDEGNVSIVCRDFLRFPLPTTRPYKVVGNIPFNLSAAIVRRVSAASPPPDDVYFILQREAGRRFAGRPFGPETLASLLLKPRWHVELVRELRRTDFDPPPRVDTVMAWLARRDRPLVAASEVEAYERFVSASFGRRGRTIKRCVRELLTSRQVRRLSTLLSFDPSAPPSSLSFDQWLGLFRFVART